MIIIDSSVRFTTDDFEQDMQAWLSEMERWDIAFSVITPSDPYVVVFNHEGNDLMYAVAAKHQDKCSCMAVANPWYGEKALRFLEDAFEKGFCGLFLHPGRQGFTLSEKIVYPLVELCEHYNKPVYTSSSTPICAMPFQLAETARHFPGAVFILGYGGWSDFWTDIIPAAQQSDNICVETSCTTGGMVYALIDALGAERVVFGSGYPRSMPEIELKKINRLNLSSDVYEKIMHDNAYRLWGIEL